MFRARFWRLSSRISAPAAPAEVVDLPTSRAEIAARHFWEDRYVRHSWGMRCWRWAGELGVAARRGRPGRPGGREEQRGGAGGTPAWVKVRTPESQIQQAVLEEEFRDWDDEKPQQPGPKVEQKIQQTAAEVPAALNGASPSGTEEASDLLGVIGRGGHLGGRTIRAERVAQPDRVHAVLDGGRTLLLQRPAGLHHQPLAGWREPRLRIPLPRRVGPRAWYGASLWYDVDNSTGYHFQDIGLSLEAMVDRFEFRGNYYTPVGKQQSILSQVNSNAQFVGNQLLFDSYSRTGTAMQGFDLEAGYSLPVDLGGVNDQLRAFAGYYRFTGTGVDDINGVKLRAELDLTSTVTTNVMFTHDGTFGSRVMAGMQFHFPWGEQERRVPLASAIRRIRSATSSGTTT